MSSNVQQNRSNLREAMVQQRRKQLRDELKSRWYVQENDVVGGYRVTTVDAPPSTGAMELADFVNEEHAKHIVELHNEWLLRESLH